MRRVVLVLCICGLALVASPAHAETELVILGPVGSDVSAAKAALAKVPNAQLVAKSIDANCVGDPGCLITAGTEVGARRVLAVSIAGDGNVTLVLVDVGTKLLLGMRDFELPPKQLAKQLPATVAKFVSAAVVEKAKTLFAEGNQHYNLGEFAHALEKYKLAYRVKPLPAFQFDIAQCHRKLGQHKDAIAMYQAYLVDVPDAQNKPMVDSLIAESKKAVDEQAQAEAQRERERLATERTKAEQARKIKEAEATAQAEAAKAEQARIAAERERERQYNRHPARTWMLITGALGVATVGAGAYFGVQARSAQDAFDEAGCGDPDVLLGQAALATCVDSRDRGERHALLGNILLGSGATVVLTSLIVLIADPGNIERPASPRVAVTGRSLGVTFQW